MNAAEQLRAAARAVAARARHDDDCPRGAAPDLGCACGLADILASLEVALGRDGQLWITESGVLVEQRGEPVDGKVETYRVATGGRLGWLWMWKLRRPPAATARMRGGGAGDDGGSPCSG